MAVAHFVREHWMLLVAAAAALASMIAVPLDAAYLGYFDWKTIGCLFCVLAVANALRRIGAFDRIARMALAHGGNPQKLALAIVLVTAAFSMAFTNDVALVVMLPLSASILIELGCVQLVPAVFSLQALAANLCGMVTPFGNPQNLYLYSYYHIGLAEFLRVMVLPFMVATLGIVAVTWLMTKLVGSSDVGCIAAWGHIGASRQGLADSLAAPLLRHAPGTGVVNREGKPIMPIDRRRMTAYAVLFAISLLAIFRVIPFVVAVVIVAAVIFIADRRALREVDYALLATFLFFFIFAGNMARIPMLETFLVPFMDKWELLASAGTSQVISNVPAAVVLSHFTDVWQPLLMGVNIGGAGTFVGSLASLIAIRYFSLAKRVFPALRADDAPTAGSFLRLFAFLNAVFFVVLLVFCQLVVGMV